MKNIILLFALLSSTLTFSQGRMASMEITPDSAWFDFWVGDWDIHWFAKDSVKETGSNKISKIMNENVILEEFKILSGVNKGFEGSSWTVYNKNTNTWKQTWVDNSGNYMDFVGGKEENNRVFYREFITNDSTHVMQKMVFSHVTPMNFIWDWLTSADGGKTWKTNWQLFYEKKQ